MDMMGWKSGGMGRKSALESLVTGLVIAAGSAAFWFFNRHAWWIGFVFLFGGVLPVVRGVRGVIAERLQAPKRRIEDERLRAVEGERAILRLAASSGGKVTPALVTMNSSLSMEEAEKALDAMAQKGHASLRVRDDGRVEYEFAEFLPM
jgi:hypothetical protein